MRMTLSVLVFLTTLGSSFWVDAMESEPITKSVAKDEDVGFDLAVLVTSLLVNSCVQVWESFNEVSAKLLNSYNLIDSSKLADEIASGIAEDLADMMANAGSS